MRYQQQPGIARRRLLCFPCLHRMPFAAIRTWATLPFVLCIISVVFLQSRSRAVDIDALIGFGQSVSSRSLYRPVTATPLTVYLTGSGVKGQGQLQVSVRTNDRTATYSRKISLTDGAIKEAHAEGFVFQLQPVEFRMGRNSATTEINVQLLVDGRQIAHKTVSLPLSTSEDSFNVLALTKYGGGLNFLQKKKMGLFHRHTNAEASVNNRMASANPTVNGVNPNAALYVAYTRTDAMPVMAQGYDMMDAVALADIPLDNLTDAQTAALKGYVRNGGLLIVSGGGDLSRLKSQFYQDLLPINVTGSAATTDVSALSARYREPLRLTTPIALLTGTLKPDAVVLFAQSPTMPLITRRAYGAGSVVLTSFDYIDPSFRGWAAAPSLWRDLLRTGNDEVSARGVLAGGSRSGNNVNLLEDALAGKRATNTPGFRTVAIFLGAYIVLLIPVSYFVLKRMDRREMAWYTAPVLIAGFTVMSYVIALSIKGGNLNVNRAAVLESQAGSDQFGGYAQMTVYSPRRANYDISLGEAGDSESGAHDVSPNEIFRPQTLTSDLTVEQNGATTLRNTQIGLWDKRSFDLPISPSLGGAVEAKVEMAAGGQVQVTVTNKTRYTIKDCALVNADRGVPIGDLAPGQSGHGMVSWAYGANSDVLRLPTAASLAGSGLPYNPQDGESPESITSKMRYAVTQVLGQSAGQNEYGYGWGADLESNFGKVPNAFVGWTTDNLLHTTIDGKAPTGEEVNLIFVHLPPPGQAPKSIAVGYNPFLAEPTLSLEDDLGPGGARAGASQGRVMQ